ncbi:MAG: hypothetical protein JWQ07_1392 [Ramlibacter sp.]|nr:hypothetical protein [Ramlibacter sp.]
MSVRTRKLLAYGAAIVVLLAVFALYTRPLILVTLADQLWACFS